MQAHIGEADLRPRSSTLHDGTASDFDALAKAGVSVKGKLVLLDANLENWWVNYQAAEATARGAIGVILTYGADSYPLLLLRSRRSGQLRRLRGNSANVPSVYISQAGRRLA